MSIKKSIILAGILVVVFMVLFSVNLAQADWVRGYNRNDGKYIQPYQRTHPDRNPYNNCGFPGNFNPNTGRITPGNPNTYIDNYNNRSYKKPYTPYNLK